jgi:hypothetical protein
MQKPSFSALWSHFPDHNRYPTLKDLYEHIGGNAERNIYQRGFGPKGNTCASRISVALNGTSTPINPALVPRDKRLSTADGHYIIFSVTQLRSYLLTTLGKPQIDRASPYDDSFRGKKGIIAFSVNWGDATGHVALFNGQSYREPVHDNYATYFVPRTPTSREVATYRGEFWELNP